MKDQLKKISASPLARNFVSVSFIQGISMLLPLLTIPYLLAVLGADGFALVNLALAVVTYFVVLSDYGFNLMGTRLVTLHRNDPARLNYIFSNMLYAQFLLTLLGILLFAAVVWLIPAYREAMYFFAATFGVVLGSTLLPTWYFQGREKFSQLHLINLGYRGVYTVSIFLLVKSKEDLLMVPLLNSGTHIAGGLAALLWIMLRYKMRFVAWRWPEILNFLKDGWHLFISAISVTSLQQLPIIILAFFVNATLVGYYAFAEKIMLLFRVLIQLLSSVLYPRVVQASQQSLYVVQKLLAKVRLLGSAALLLLGGLLFFTPNILAEFLPTYYHPSLRPLLQIWSLLPLALFSKIIAQQLLLAYNLTKAYAQVMIMGALLNLLLLLLLSFAFKYRGTALAVLVTEVFLIFALNWKSRILVSKKS